MKPFPLSLALVVAGHLLAGTAVAQDRPERPYRGLFASGAGDAEQVLTVNGSAGAGYDTSVLADAADAGLGGVSGPAASQAGSYGILGAGASYSFNKDSVGLGASYSSSARYYPTVSNSFVTTHGAAVAGSWAATNRTRFSGNQTISYQPFSLFSLFPELQTAFAGQAVLADLDFNTFRRGYVSYSSGAGVTRELSRRSQLSADYAYSSSDFSVFQGGFSMHSGNVRFTRALTAGLGLRVGYGYSRAQYEGIGSDDTVGRHLLDTGVDYNKTLSFSRRTTFSFSTGGSAITDQETTHFNAIGSARLNHEMGRTWQYDASYNRSVGFVETFAAPFVYDSVTTGLSGLISRRLSFHASAGAMFGQIGFGQGASGNGFDTMYGTAGIGRALNRHLSVGLDYSFYRYGFDQTTLLPDGVLNQLSRHSVRATLSAWTPVFQRGRRRDAAR